MTETDLDHIRSKLNGLAGVALRDDEVATLLAEVINGGGGVQIEYDASSRFRLLRRDGKFVLAKDTPRARPSSIPPRR